MNDKLLTKIEQPGRPEFDIIRTAHIEYYVTDLQRSREFYVDALGMIETESDRNHIYLRGVEDRFHHCIVLTKADKPAVGHIAYRVRDDQDLRRLASLFETERLPYKWTKSGQEKSVGRALRVQDPLGFPVEFYSKMDEVEWLWQSFQYHQGARVARIDHVNLFVSNVNKAAGWYMGKLGFMCTEYTETEEQDSRLWAIWLKRKPTVHDVALMSGVGPRVHHTGLYVSEKSSILDAADILASKGYLKMIERGPGRHGISNAFFLYLLDPDGHRVELFTGDYLSVEPDWKPLRWKFSNPQRQTFWGAPTPESWFNEASKVMSIFSGEKIRTVKPLLPKG